jgi:NAD(P)-dependent dehydrogenase (short-subunit alcohol dehydrogenase family)
MKIDGSVALVTGGASGLGEATVRALVARGGKAVAVDLNAERGEALAKELGPAVAFVRADVTDPDQVQAAVDRASELGPLRVAVSCAGIGWAQRTVGRDGSPHDLKPFTQVITVNLVGTFNVLRLSASAMSKLDPTPEGERGVVVNTASIAAFDGQIGQAAYASSKGGVVGLTLPAARELAGQAIRVCTIAPGIFETAMLKGLPQNVQDSLGASVPFPSRLGRPAEYAALVRHVVENSMLNGETIRLDGALRMAPK